MTSRTVHFTGRTKTRKKNEQPFLITPLIQHLQTYVRRVSIKCEPNSTNNTTAISVTKTEEGDSVEKYQRDLSVCDKSTSFHFQNRLPVLAPNEEKASQMLGRNSRL
jgi:hypothetical protein